MRGEPMTGVPRIRPVPDGGVFWRLDRLRTISAHPSVARCSSRAEIQTRCIRALRRNSRERCYTIVAAGLCSKVYG